MESYLSSTANEPTHDMIQVQDPVIDDSDEDDNVKTPTVTIRHDTDDDGNQKDVSHFRLCVTGVVVEINT